MSWDVLLGIVAFLDKVPGFQVDEVHEGGPHRRHWPRKFRVFNFRPPPKVVKIRSLDYAWVVDGGKNSSCQILTLYFFSNPPFHFGIET